MIQLASPFKVYTAPLFPFSFTSYLPPGTSPPSGVTAVQAGPTSITVSWSPSSDATGYRIDYESSGGYGMVGVVGGSTDMETLTGLQNGDTYTISIVATSDTGLPSESVPADMSVGLSKSKYMHTLPLHMCISKTV